MGSEIWKVPPVLSLEEGILEIGGCCNVITSYIEDKAKDQFWLWHRQAEVRKGKRCLRDM